MSSGVFTGVNWRLYRVKLPVVFGALSVVLMLWDLHNDKVSMEMGLSWDTGAPIWPYRMPQLLVPIVNWPAYLLVAPIFWLLGSQMFWVHYIVLLPFIVLWWYWVGRRVDYGLVPSSWLKAGKRVVVLPLLVGVGFTGFGLMTAVEGLTWWFRYGGSVWSPRVMLLASDMAPAAWGFVLAIWMGLIAARVWSYRESDC